MVRLFTGAGGMGKTRLAIELCLRMRCEGWRTGFIQFAADTAPLDIARRLVEGMGPLLAVIDYAETRRGLGRDEEAVEAWRRGLDATRRRPQHDGAAALPYLALLQLEGPTDHALLAEALERFPGHPQLR